MGNVDFLNEDDFFSTLKKEISKDSDKFQDAAGSELELPAELLMEHNEPEESPAGPRVDLKHAPEDWDQNIFEAGTHEKEPGDFQEDVERNLELDRAAAPQEDGPATNARKLDLVEFYDEKQDKISYKPFYIAGIVIVILVAGFFALRYFLFSSPKEETAAQKINAEEIKESVRDSLAHPQKQLKATRTAKSMYYAEIAGKTEHEISSIAELINLAEQDVRITSILMYDREILFEVFSPNRDKLSNISSKLKSRYQNNYKLVSSQIRTGQNAGIINLYTLEFPAASQSAKDIAPSALTDVAGIKSWLNSLLQKNSLKCDNMNPNASKSGEDVTVYEFDTRVTGSYKDCLKMLTSMASERRNIKIHKLTLNSLDQKAFNPSTYQMKLIIRVFV
jgi:Tfp pilus assembly protein PilO